LVPSIDDKSIVDELEAPRVLKPRLSSEALAAAVRAEIESGETERVEYKSTLYFDWNRAENCPDQSRNAMKSKGVRDDALRAVCGLLNADGGVVLIGVRGNGTVCGIQEDFRFTGGNSATPECKDKWQLHFGDLIRGKFSGGWRIAPFVRVDMVEINDLTVARVSVTKSPRLACVQYDGRLAMFVRRGPRTDPVPLDFVEDLVMQRMQSA
jgi:predicted HTH transcriptional regulator